MVKIVYTNQGAIRNRPISDRLRRVLEAAGRAAGIDEVRIFSGGQAARGEPGPRTGSIRHDRGSGADIRLIAGGRELNFQNPADRRVVQSFVSAARQAGATGIGAGVDYMGPTSLHVGFGAPAVWGAGGRSINAPDWLIAAYNQTAPANPAVAAINNDATIAPPRTVTTVAFRPADLKWDSPDTLRMNPAAAQVGEFNGVPSERMAGPLQAPQPAARDIGGSIPPWLSYYPGGVGSPAPDVLSEAARALNMTRASPGADSMKAWGAPWTPRQNTGLLETSLAQLPQNMNPVDASPPIGGAPIATPPAPRPNPIPPAQRPHTPTGPTGGGPFNIGNGGVFQGIGYQGPPGPFSLANDWLSPWMFDPPVYSRGMNRTRPAVPMPQTRQGMGFGGLLGRLLRGRPPFTV